MKEKIITIKEKSTETKDNKIKEIQDDEFIEVVSISTGKIKRMRFTKDLRFKNNN